MVDRRQFAQTVAAGLLAVPALKTAFAATETGAKGAALTNAKAVEKGASTAAFTAGKQYKVLKPAQPTDVAAGKIAVIEFFWYACPHCLELEPLLETWIKTLPKYVAFKRIPVDFGQVFDPKLQKVYYALSSMGQIEKFQLSLMRAVQGVSPENTRANRVDLSTDAKIFAWLTQGGVDMAKFKPLYNSFDAEVSTKKDNATVNGYGVEGVPSIAVAGKYMTDPGKVTGLPQMLQVVDFLIAKEHA